jgi:hypothetical protein
MKNWQKIVVMGLVAVAVTVAFTPVAMALFNLGPLLGGLVSAVVGVVVGVATGNPGAGMAVAMMVCTLVCVPPQNTSGTGGQNPPTGPGSPSGAVCDSFTASPSTLNAPGNVTLSWETTRAHRVTITPDVGRVPADGSRQVYVDSTTTYTLTGDHRVYADCQRTVTVTVTQPAVTGPGVSLEAQSPSAGVSWTGSNFSVVTGNTVDLRWNVSGNAESCRSSNFSWGNDYNGEETPQVQPVGGSPVTYVLTCEDGDGNNTTDQITITANDVAPILNATKTTVRISEPFTLTWNLNGNNPAECVLRGPGSHFQAMGSITGDGSDTIEAAGTATYTLECPGGEDSVQINVLPEIYES